MLLLLLLFFLYAGVSSLKREEIDNACEDFSNILGSLPDCTLYKGRLSSGIEIAVTDVATKSSEDWSCVHEARFRQKVLCLFTCFTIIVSLFLI